MWSFMAIMILILLNLGCVYITGFFTLDGKNIFLLLREKDFRGDNKDLIHKSYHHQIFQKDKTRDKKTSGGIYITPGNTV